MQLGDVDDVVHDAGGAHRPAELEVAGAHFGVLHARRSARPRTEFGFGLSPIGLPSLSFVPVSRSSRCRRVLVGAMHQQLADARRVFGVLADADVDLVVVDDRRADEVAAWCRCRRVRTRASFGLQSNFQISSPVSGLEAVAASRRRRGR